MKDTCKVNWGFFSFLQILSETEWRLPSNNNNTGSNNGLYLTRVIHNSLRPITNPWPSNSQSNWNLENQRTQRKTLGVTKRPNNKLNPHMTPGLGIEPGTHWWEASALTIGGAIPAVTIGSLQSHFFRDDEDKSRRRQKKLKLYGMTTICFIA